MSVEKWAWRESCDTDYCIGDCDHCPRADYDEECDNDCEHCDWVTCPKAEEGADE